MTPSPPPTNTEVSPEQPPQSPTNASELDANASNPPTPGTHSSTEAERIDAAITEELEKEPATLDSVSDAFLEVQHQLARLIEQQTGKRPPTAPILGATDVLLTGSITLTDSRGIIKHLDVSAPMYGVMDPGALPMALKTLQGVLSLLILRPVNVAWTNYVSDKTERLPFSAGNSLMPSQNNSMPGGDDFDERSTLEKNLQARQ